ncbi:gfo/Idh/MocA family oxidoreductase, partial [candidate division KSB3 bacterium]|nr:gfo/Idh/MocA family oxidoreductase [candidate division KSB3 bacterium]
TFIDEHSNLKTIAVCDQYFKGAGVLENGIRYYQSYERLIEETLDVLFVCLPNYMATEVTIAGLERGMHVFCEKPPGCVVGDVERVIEVERKNPGLLLKYGFNHRCHDSVRKALEIINSKTLGNIFCLRGVYGKSKIHAFTGGWRAERKYAGGGILLDQGIHMVDLMRLFCGDFAEVKSFVSNKFWKHDVEDNAYALMKDRQGRVAMLHSSATQWQHRFSLNIALTEGYLELQGILTSSQSYGQESLIIGRRDESDYGTLRYETLRYLQDNSWREEIDEFAAAIIKGGRITNGSSLEALETMKLVYRIYYADSEWREKYGIQNPDG